MGIFKKASKATTIILASFLLVSCDNFSSQGNYELQEIDVEADIAAINAVTEQVREAYMARDWDRFSGLFTEDAIWMPGDVLPLTGKAAWWSFVEQFWDSTAIVEMDLVSEEIIVAGDWAYERHTETTVTIPTEGDGEPSTSRFKGVWLFHREADGSWKITRYIWNRNPAST
ncbi:MAG: SgcJ/EcaC family oxidoreductase [Proteobacteria bacterium]|nr:SgcJ/EcaC family oxidoreductase [Pseudomonadota bacterium]